MIPISTSTNRPGKPINLGQAWVPFGGSIAVTPNGKALYAAARNKVVPISTATNTPGKTIRLPFGRPSQILTTP